MNKNRSWTINYLFKWTLFFFSFFFFIIDENKSSWNSNGKPFVCIFKIAKKIKDCYQKLFKLLSLFQLQNIIMSIVKIKSNKKKYELKIHNLKMIFAFVVNSSWFRCDRFKRSSRTNQYFRIVFCVWNHGTSANVTTYAKCNALKD